MRVPASQPTSSLTWKQDLGLQILQARNKRDWTQSRLGKVMGVRRQMISRYEAGESAPDVDALAAAAKALDWTFEIGGCRISPQTVTAKKPVAVPRQMELDFGKSQTFKRATIRITPQNWEILISSVGVLRRRSAR